MSGVNGNSPPNPDQPDPAAMMQAKMAMALRQIETIFPGCHLTIFIADPLNAGKFSYVTSAPVDMLRSTVTAFVEDTGGWAE